MANLGNSVKTAFLKGLEALGKTASNLTDAAQHKLNEMNLDNRRREVLLEIPKCVMQLWKEGVEMPEPLAALLTELTDVEQQLAVLRAQREAKNAKSEEPREEAAADETADAAEETLDETVFEEAAEETAEESICEEAVFEESPCEESVEEPSCECAAEPCCEDVAEPEADENV